MAGYNDEHENEYDLRARQAEKPMADHAELIAGLKPVAWRYRVWLSELGKWGDWSHVPVLPFPPAGVRIESEPLYSADALASLVRERDEARKERDHLKSGVNAVVNCQSALTRAQVREAMDDLLVKGGWAAWGTENQSPFVERSEAAEARATAAEADAARMREALEAGGGTAVTEDGVVLTIQISGSTLANAVKYMPKAEIFDEGLQEFFQPEVVDDAAFLKEMARALRHEEEDGTTLVHRMLDEAAIHIMHVGGDGVLSAQEVRDRARAALSNTSEGGVR